MAGLEALRSSPAFFCALVCVLKGKEKEK